MNSLLLVAAILSALTLGGRSQTACGNTRDCTTSCRASSGSCCVLEPQTPSDNFPLGYTTYFLPGTDSNDPFPCVRVEFPAGAENGINYLVVAAETAGTSLCIRESGSTTAATCGSNGVFFCMTVTITGGQRYVDLDLLCEGVGPSCEAADSSFFIKPQISTVANDIEDFCDTNGTLPLPSSLRFATNAPNVDSTMLTPRPAGAIPLLSSILTIISMLAIWAWLQ